MGGWLNREGWRAREEKGQRAEVSVARLGAFVDAQRNGVTASDSVPDGIYTYMFGYLCINRLIVNKRA